MATDDRNTTDVGEPSATDARRVWHTPTLTEVEFVETAAGPPIGLNSDGVGYSGLFLDV